MRYGVRPPTKSSTEWDQLTLARGDLSAKVLEDAIELSNYNLSLSPIICPWGSFRGSESITSGSGSFTYQFRYWSPGRSGHRRWVIKASGNSYGALSITAGTTVMEVGSKKSYNADRQVTVVDEFFTPSAGYQTCSLELECLSGATINYIDFMCYEVPYPTPQLVSTYGMHPEQRGLVTADKFKWINTAQDVVNGARGVLWCKARPTEFSGSSTSSGTFATLDTSLVRGYDYNNGSYESETVNAPVIARRDRDFTNPGGFNLFLGQKCEFHVYAKMTDVGATGEVELSLSNDSDTFTVTGINSTTAAWYSVAITPACEHLNNAGMYPLENQEGTTDRFDYVYDVRGRVSSGTGSIRVYSTIILEK